MYTQYIIMYTVVYSIKLLYYKFILKLLINIYLFNMYTICNNQKVMLFFYFNKYS